ncbi:MFS transporter [Nonomuraea basaltis]|uniref:MFS transporter n=1 Tax=Nonomuraea basaltis TaxID=2495887 RepID=UPI0014868291|nr:MFS transporter [Nonomuraea basaltis]
MARQSTKDRTEQGPQPRDRRWLGLFFLLLAGVMDLVDATVVNIALPAIREDLSASYADMQWISSGYALAFALTLVTGGRLGDIAGRRRLFLIGAAGFVVASLLCGLAPDPETLIAARLLQGIMAGAMVPQILAIMTVTFGPEERGKAFALFAGMATVATVGGPPLGAFLTEADVLGLGWRAIFLVNLPLGIMAIAGAVTCVRESRSSQRLGLDWIGMIIATAAVFLLIFPLVQGRELGWPVWTFVALAAAVPTLIGFVLYERRRTGSPLVEMSLFRVRSFVGGTLIYLIFMAGIIAYYFVLMVYLQVGLGFTVLAAGLTILPFAVGTPVGAGIAPGLIAKIGRNAILTGAILLALAMGGVILAVRTAGTEVGFWHLAPALLLGGIGMGMVVTPLFDFVLSEVPGEHAGSASGVLNAFQQIGAATGVAVIGVVFFSLVGPRATAESFTDAIQWTLAIQAAIFLVVAALVMLLPRRPAYQEPTP